MLGDLIEDAPATSFSELPPIVLVVDEARDTLPIYSAYLESAGMWVSTSTQPVEALATAHELRPDVIITDVGLTEGSAGLAFISGLAMSAATLDIPLIALTTRSLPVIPRSARVRTSRCLVKPVAPDALIADVQQLLLQACAVRLRADRENNNLRQLAERSRGLMPIADSTADRFIRATRTCPACAHPLEWIENGRIGAVSYDYYQWCGKGCGLFCYDLDAKRWVKLAGSSHVQPVADHHESTEPRPSGAPGIVIVTDRAGYISTIDASGARLLNLSSRHAIGASLLLYIQEGRQQMLEDLQRVDGVSLPQRSVVFRPRDRKPRPASMSVCETVGGIRWTIHSEPVPVLPPRNRRLSGGPPSADDDATA